MAGQCVGQPDRAAQSRRPAIRPRRARRGAQGSRRVHRHLQLAATFADVRRADGRRDGVPLPRRHERAALQGCAQGVRRSDRARLDEPGSAAARGRAVPRQVQQRRREEERGGAAGEESAASARAARVGARRVLRRERRRGGHRSRRASRSTRTRRRRARSSASIYFDGEDYAAAAREAEQALATDSTLVEGLSVLAASRYLQGDRAGFDALKRRALAHNPKEADFFTNLAEAAARNRLYRAGGRLRARRRRCRFDGVAGVRRVRHEPAPRRRDGRREEEPRPCVRRRSVRRLDQEHARPARHVQGLSRDDVAALPLRRSTARSRSCCPRTSASLREAAYDSLAARYQYKPPTPIRLEVYRSHADFSVRTVGLAGLGALGVSFGTTLAMDSPAARDAGDFNWGSTFWHELAHTFTLGASDHRVPRWLSEGLVGARGASRPEGVGRRRDARISRRVQGRAAGEGEPDERRLHAAGVSAAADLLVLPGVARRRADRARLRSARDRRHAQRVQDGRDHGAGVSARAQDEPRGVRREVRRVHQGAVREAAGGRRAQGRARRRHAARAGGRRRIHRGAVARASPRSR